MVDVTFRGNTRVGLVLWACGVLATALSAWAFARELVSWGPLFGSALFTVIITQSLLKMRSLYLRLDDDALETGSRHRDTVRIPWREVNHVEVVEMGEGPAKGREAIRVVYSAPAREELVIEDEFNAPLRQILGALHRHLSSVPGEENGQN